MNAISARPAMRLRVVRFRRFARLVGWLLLMVSVPVFVVFILILLVFVGESLC